MLMSRSMNIVCPACATRYAIADSAIGVDGRVVRCAKCQHSWFQEGPETDATPAPVTPAPLPAETASSTVETPEPPVETASFIVEKPAPPDETPSATGEVAAASPY